LVIVSLRSAPRGQLRLRPAVLMAERRFGSVLRGAVERAGWAGPPSGTGQSEHEL